MKTRMIFLTLVLASLTAFTQSPDGFNYQAILRDYGGEVLINSQLSLRVTIYAGSAQGMQMYQEIHSVQTNGFGLVNLVIGRGMVQSGSFAEINWGEDVHFLQIDLDLAGTGQYQTMGVSELLSVPYAKYADSAGNISYSDTCAINELQVLTRSGELIELSMGGGSVSITDADADPTNEFQTLTKTGNLVELSNGGGAFEDEVEDADSDPQNEVNTGMLVQGNELTLTDAGGTLLTPIAAIYPSVEGQVLTWNNSAQQWEAKNPVAGGGNGWSLSGNSGTIDGTHFLGTTDDVPVNFRVNNAKAGRIASNGVVFLGLKAGENNLSNEITGIGYNSLFSNTSGARNTALGYQSLYSNTTGNNNTATGYQSLFSNITGISNTANGYQAAYSTTVGDKITAIGYRSLYNNTTGYNNTAVGCQSLAGNTTGNNNTALGVWALWSNTTGFQNIAVGGGAMQNNTTGANNTATGMQALYSNISGNYNSAFGYLALSANTSGQDNTAFGGQALLSNSTGFNNTATGFSALLQNTIGNNNSAFGGQVMQSNTTGSDNSAFGYRSLFNNLTGNDNTAFGFNSMNANTSGSFNVAIGFEALYKNINGHYNYAFGYRALYNNTTGQQNTASGYHSMFENTSGDYNCATGNGSLADNYSGIGNCAFGASALGFNTVGNYNVAVGYGALPQIDGSFNTALGSIAFQYNISTIENSMGLGYYATPNASNQVRVGNSSITSIGGQVGWTTLSDERVKKDVTENVKGLDFIMELRPVTYFYDIDKEKELFGITHDTASWDGKDNISQMRMSGFLAQEVEVAAQKTGYSFSGVDSSGGIYGLRYAEFTVPLVKAVQEQQVIINDLKRELSEMKTRHAVLENRLINK